MRLGGRGGVGGGVRGGTLHAASLLLAACIRPSPGRGGELRGGLGGGGNGPAAATTTTATAVPRPSHGHGADFRPLTCNEDLGPESCASNPWSETGYGGYGDGDDGGGPSRGRVTIPCGTCVTVDRCVDGDGGRGWGEDDVDVGAPPPPPLVLDLPHGLDVRGWLVFPEGCRAVLRAPFVHVQGRLTISSTGRVSPPAGPGVRFVLTGSDGGVEASSLDPHPENSAACGGGRCDVGRRPIVAAGGELRISGLPRDCPSWTVLRDVIRSGGDAGEGEGDIVALVVDGSVDACWGVGSEVLITSHTRDPRDGQVRRILSAATRGGAEGGRRGSTDDAPVAATTTLELDGPPILSPTTAADSEDFAVEVALLSRNVVFEALEGDGGDGDGAHEGNDALHGPHLIVLRSPDIRQELEGVELRGFGQQGNIGRCECRCHFFSPRSSLPSRNDDLPPPVVFELL